MARLHCMIILFLFAATVCSSQVPQQFNYQAVARNAAGVPMANQPIKLRLSIHAGAAGGSIVYSESRTLTTNSFGLFTVVIGNGTAETITGSITAIDWSAAPHFLQVEIDINNGNNFISMGTTQLISVPYALHAERSTIATNLQLPFAANAALGVPLLDLKNTSSGTTMKLEKSDFNSTANVLEVITSSTNTGGGIYARKGFSGANINVKGAITGEAGNSDIGVAGYADDDFGIYGSSRESHAIYGKSSSGGKAGVFGTTDHDLGDGVVGQATTGKAIMGYATSGTAGHFHAATGKALYTNGQVQLDNTGQPVGKTLMTDGNGNAHWEGGIAFSVHSITNLLNVQDGTMVLVPFSTVTYNLGNHYHTGADLLNPYTFIAPVGGVYHFAAGVLWTAFDNVIGTASINIRVNGINRLYNKLAAYGEQQSTNISGDLLLNAGDKVTVAVFQTSNVSERVSNTFGNYFSGRFVMKN